MTQFTFLKDKVLLLTPRWTDDAKIDKENMSDQLVHIRKVCAGVVATKWEALIMLPIDGGALVRKGWMGIKFEVLGKGFDLIKLGPGTWKVDAMVQAKEGVNAYVILCGVPEPAPWDAVGNAVLLNPKPAPLEGACHTDYTPTSSCPSSSEEKPVLSKAV